MTSKKSNRNISASEYFDALQLEYLFYELRSKIYPYSKDKEKFRSIMSYKKSKIFDISKKNNLSNIFDNNQKYDYFLNKLFFDFVSGQIATPKDKYFYYSIGSEFSYNGEVWKIKKYDLKKFVAVICRGNSEIETKISDIRRIL